MNICREKGKRRNTLLTTPSHISVSRLAKGIEATGVERSLEAVSPGTHSQDRHDLKRKFSQK